jgi:hypothetical protein
VGVKQRLLDTPAERLSHDEHLQLVAGRFDAAMPEDVQAGDCNALDPRGVAVWSKQAQQVFHR